MATIPLNARKISSSGDLDVYIIEWLQVHAADVCLPYTGPGWADRNVQVLGTPGVGMHVKFDGSNSGTPALPPQPVVLPAENEYSSLTSNGTVIDMTAVGWTIFDIVPAFIRPVVTGDGNTLVDIRMLVRRTH